MKNEDHLQQHFELCKRIYLRMLAEDSWPWKEETDSQDSDDVVESDGNQDDI